MYFQFLIEDQSSAKLVEILMNKLIDQRQDVTYKCKPFYGLGGLTKKNTAKETKTGKLLNDLATYLRGFNKSLRGIPAAIIVVLDNDDRNTAEFKEQLENVAVQNNIQIDHVFCVAVEEVEAWLLGDEKAIFAAYPNARASILHSYEQDSICGTWEVLADVVYIGGITKFKKQNQTFVEIGQYKCEWAERIGNFMSINENKSPGFRDFIEQIQRRFPDAS